LKRKTELTRSVASSTVGAGVLSFFAPKTRFIATNHTSSTTTVHTNSICHKKTTFQLQPPGTNDSLEMTNIPRDPGYCRWHTTQEMPKWVSSQARPNSGLLRCSNNEDAGDTEFAWKGRLCHRKRSLNFSSSRIHPSSLT
jgi:hypothetical protein